MSLDAFVEDIFSGIKLKVNIYFTVRRFCRINFSNLTVLDSLYIDFIFYQDFSIDTNKVWEGDVSCMFVRI